MQKNFNDSINPIKVNFISLDTNATDTTVKIKNEDISPIGEGNINGFRTFYFARIASEMKTFPSTNKRVIKTPLYVEIYCKVIGNRGFCDNDMNLATIGRNTHKTDRGWYLAKEHNGAADGQVTSLTSHKIKVNKNDDDENHIATNHPNNINIPNFIDGRIDTIETRYTAEKLTKTNKAKITIDSDIWLQFDNSSYTVTFKDIAETTGVGKNGHMLQRRPQIERNGKMSW